MRAEPGTTLQGATHGRAGYAWCVCVCANLLSSPTADTRPGNHRPSSHFASTRDWTAMSHGLPLSLTAELVLAQDVLANGFSSSNWAAFLLLPLPCSTHQREAGSSQHPFTQRRQRTKLDAGRLAVGRTSAPLEPSYCSSAEEAWHLAALLRQVGWCQVWSAGVARLQ